MKNKNIVMVWAWMNPSGLGKWAVSSDLSLGGWNQPWPESKPTKCILMTHREYVRMKKEITQLNQIIEDELNSGTMLM